MPSIELLFGAGGIGKGAISHSWTTAEETNGLLAQLQDLGLRHLDSAAGYPPGAPWVTETLLGETKAAEKGFLIDSKISVRPIGRPHDPSAKLASNSLTEENIEASVKKSLELIGVEKLSVLYAHGPDPVTPLEETARSFDKQFRAGHFERLGLSNYTAPQMREYLSICSEKGFVKPTVYQGSYNAICRQFEKDLYPLLKEHGIKLIAYSPLSGGFLTGKVSRQTQDTDLSTTRWAPGKAPFYPNTYDKPVLHSAMVKFCGICDSAGISSTEASLRWLIHHSALSDGDGLILGATKVDQLARSVEFCKKGPLDENILKGFDELWEAAEEAGATF